MGTVFSSFGHTAFMILLLGGTVDLLVGSLGLGNKSDLQQAASKFDINPWIIRSFGLFWVICVTLTLLVVVL